MKIMKYISFISEVCKNFIREKDKIYYITEDANWVINEIGRSLRPYISNFVIVKTCIGLKNSIIHFASLNTFLSASGYRLPHSSNKIVVTAFHIVDGDPRSSFIKDADNFVSVWHTSCQITKKKLITCGASICKIVVIPIGIEVGAFYPLSWKEKHYKRKKLVIPKNAIVIGSFQKDGNGWSEGLEPKLIKGPDIFCDSIEILSKKYSIFVLLTGPARGYVKKRLEESKISYHYSYMEKPNDVSVYFQLCDLYIVTSREEGGPRALMEAMASGVPLISTKVGMAPDIIKNGKNGFLVDIEDTDSIIHKASDIINSAELQKKLIENGLQNVEKYDWINLEKKYQDKIYTRLKSE